MYPEYNESFSGSNNKGSDVLSRESKGQSPAQPYGGEGSQTGLVEKTTQSDTNRTDPITSETGAKQTPATANSIVGANQLAADAASRSPEEVLGNAAERANMGKGAVSGYEFAGPYDYPDRGVAGSSRLDSTLTAMGAWRSKTGEHSNSLWSSKMKARGSGEAKNPKLFKFSSKGEGRWKSVGGGKKQNMDYMNKISAKQQGANWMQEGIRGSTLHDYMSSQLRNKQKDVQLGRKGNRIMNEKKSDGHSQM